MQNNFVHVFVPRWSDLEEALSAMHAQAEPLNRADGRLLMFCEKFAATHPELCAPEVLRALASWRLQRDRRSFPNTVSQVQVVFSTWDALRGEPFREYLAAQAPRLVEEFCSMPEDFVRVVRVNLFLPPLEAVRLARHLAATLPHEVALRNAVAKLEMSRVTSTTQAGLGYPTLILYLSSCAKGRAEVRRWLARELDGRFRVESPPVEYAEVWQNGVTLTEGYRLYKRYLALLGRLDRVYDAASGYARAV